MATPLISLRLEMLLVQSHIHIKAMKWLPLKLKARFLELCTEGSYWLDLIRWGNVADVFADKGFIKGKREVLSISQEILNLNKLLVQNPGY